MIELPCLIGDEEFQTLKKFFEKNNPQLSNDSVTIRGKIQELQDFMQELTEQPEIKPEEIRDSVIILSQGINFLLLYLGEKQIDYLKLLGDKVKIEEKKVLPEPILSKHIAVYVSDIVFANSLKQSLNLNSALRYQTYLSIDEILANIINGQICGIIGIHLSLDGNIENTLRHDLKNMEDYDYDLAQAYVFPPCADFFQPLLLLKIMETIYLMQLGKYLTPDSQTMSINEFLPTLRSLMLVPKRTVHISIIDDIENEIKGMLKILSIWPNIKCEKIIPDCVEPFFNSKSIYLLDEDLKDFTGTQLYELRVKDDPGAIYASTSGGDAPDWAKFHFSQKNMILNNQEAALRFVRFINLLLQQFHNI